MIFCLDKRYGEKEIKEIKKNNNFGEIEMCLNEKLSYNIKIKSRNCELFLLKKSNFLKLSVNFKEFIENFLQKSLMKYLKFNEEKNKMIKEFETLMNKANNKNKEKEKEKEKDEDKKSNNSDKSSNHNHLIESERSKKKEEDSDSHMDDSENNTKNNLIDETSGKTPKGNSNRSKKSDEKSNSNLSLIHLKEMKSEDGDLNEQLKKKIDKISNILEAGNLNLDGIEDDPKELLKKIKLETDLNKKNELVDKLEEIMKKVFEKNPKKN